MYKAIILTSVFSAVLILMSSFFQKYDLAKSIEKGKEVYESYCVTCHMPDGAGTEIFPPVAKTDYLKKPVKTLVNIILLGQSGEITVNKKKYDALMPPQPYLGDEQIADVLNFIRNRMGNKVPGVITPEQVKAFR